MKIQVSSVTSIFYILCNKYEGVNHFCCLGDMISAGGRVEASTIARIRSGWKSFRVVLPLLASQVISFF